MSSSDQPKRTRYSARVLYNAKMVARILDSLPDDSWVGPTDWGGLEVHVGRHLWGHIVKGPNGIVLDRSQSALRDMVPCPNPLCDGGTIDSGGVTEQGQPIYLRCTDCDGLGWIPDKE